jgi:hypothetical protein
VEKVVDAKRCIAADAVRARRRWMREQGSFHPSWPVFIGEISTSTNRYGFVADAGSSI